MLVAARRLGQAAASEIDLGRTVRHFLDFWRPEIRRHFQCEEEVMLPAFAGAVPADDPLIVRTHTEHVALRRAVRQLERSAAEPGAKLAAERAGALGRELDGHIRFEERALFPAIEAVLAGPRLAELGREIEAFTVAAGGGSGALSGACARRSG